MDSRTFTVTPAQLDGLAAFLKGHGIAFDPTQPQGSTNTEGWQLAWTIADGVLTVTVIKHPFAEEGAFWSKLTSLLRA